MTELERALASLELAWPRTPAFDLRRPARRRWPFAVGAVVLAVGVAFAVPPARSAILRLLHLRGVSIERVQTLPAARARPLARTLGVPVSPAEARVVLGRPFRYPDGVPGPLYRSGQSISLLVGAPEPVLLTEIRVGLDSSVVLKKLVGGATSVVDTRVADRRAVWISGALHVYELPPAAPRLARNVLLWGEGDVLYRLEGARLTLDRARAIASRTVG
jgi:hypothetical protein